MLLILISWIYLFVTALVFGVAFKRLLKLEKLNIVITLFLGLFSITLLAGFWAIFFAIDALFYSILLILNIIFFILNKSGIFNVIDQLIKKIKTLLPIFKILLVLLTVLLLAKCATAPFLIDNETYYIQTIKWLNNYGLTKGLVNLHPFLGQTSNWHILQSSFNFGFIYNKLNDISGFTLLLGNIYAFFKLNNYIKTIDKKRTDLIIGLFPMFNIFLFQFINTPSPDIAIYVLALIIFSEFIVCYKTFSKQAFYSVFILSVFAVFIKLNAVFFIILPIILYKRYYIFTRRTTSTIFVLSATTLGLLIIKNIIITGSALYPINSIEALKTSWSLPNTIHNYLASYEKAASYGFTLKEYQNTSVLNVLKSWLTQPKLDGFFNCLMVLLLIICPFFISKIKEKKALFIIYGLALIFFVFLLFISPQYRFFFPFLMFLSLVISAFIFKKNTVITLILSLSILLPIIPLFFYSSTSALTNMPWHKTTSTFSFQYLLEPHSNSKYKNDFETITVGNTTIHSIINGSDFIWETGNLPLPALNNTQMKYFKTYFRVIPQQYTNNLKDGFYSKLFKDE